MDRDRVSIGDVAAAHFAGVQAVLGEDGLPAGERSMLAVMREFDLAYPKHRPWEALVGELRQATSGTQTQTGGE